MPVFCIQYNRTNLPIFFQKNSVPLQPFFYYLCNFCISFNNLFIILRSVRYGTFCAVLSSTCCNLKISAAVLSKRIKRTVAKQTVKFVLINPFVTREIFTFFMTEKRIFFSFHTLSTISICARLHSLIFRTKVCSHTLAFRFLIQYSFASHACCIKKPPYGGSHCTQKKHIPCFFIY